MCLNFNEITQQRSNFITQMNTPDGGFIKYVMHCCSYFISMRIYSDVYLVLKGV